MRGTRLLAAAAIAAAAVTLPATVPPAEAAVATVNVYALGDFHGRIEANDEAAGIAVIGSFLDQARELSPASLFVSTGDNVGGSPFVSAASGDRATVDLLGAAGLDLTAIGDHELLAGMTALAGHVAAADFPFLAANVYDRATGNRPYPAYSVQSVGGVTVGFVSVVTTEASALLAARNIAGLQIRDPIAAANAVAAQLSDGKGSNGEADVVILLAHAGATGPDTAADPTTVFGKITTGASDDIDAIVGGHTHTSYVTEIDGRPVLQPGEYGETLGKLTLRVDTTRQTVRVEAEVVDLVTPDGPITAPKPALAARVTAAVTDAAGPGAAAVATITADLNRAQTLDGKVDSAAPSTLANAVADGFVWAARPLGAQAALVDPDTLAADLHFEPTGAPGDAEGIVTAAEAAGVLPEPEQLRIVQMTGAQLAQVLDEQARATDPRVLGVSYSLWSARVRSDHTVATLLLDGKPVDADQVVTVAVSAGLLADGGPTLAGLVGADSGTTTTGAFTGYLGAVGILSPDYRPRSIVADLLGAPLAAPDRATTIRLTSLGYTTNETGPESVVASIAGIGIGTLPVTDGEVDITISRAVKQRLAGMNLLGEPLQLDLTVPSTGQTVSVDLTGRS